MTTDIQEKIDKLPKWEKEYIANLQNRVAVLQQLRDASLQDRKETKVCWEYNGDKNYIPDGAYVSFFVMDGKVEVHLGDGVLRIYGNDKIKIIPQVANSIYIAIDK